MPRYFVLNDAKDGNCIRITGADAAHMMQSLRMRVGDSIDVVVDEDGVYVTKITEVRGSTVLVDIQGKLDERRDPPVRFVLYQGIAKGERMDLAVQKAVELGVAAVVPFTSRACVVRLDDRRAQKRQERWQRIAHEAAKQCLRSAIPTVHQPVSFDTVVQETAAGRHDLVIFPYERTAGQYLKDVEAANPASIGVIIGPEGGFLGPEGDQLIAAGAQAISLGPRILRTETAGIVALSLLGARFGDLDRKGE